MEEPEQEPVRGGATNRRNDSTAVQEPHPSFRRRDYYWDHFEYVCSFILIIHWPGITF